MITTFNLLVPQCTVIVQYVSLLHVVHTPLARLNGPGAHLHMLDRKADERPGCIRSWQKNDILLQGNVLQT